MKLLLLITDLEIGGTPTVVRELAIRLRSAGIETHVACLKGFGPVAMQLQRAGVPVKSFGAGSLIDLPAAVSELRQHVRDQTFDVVFSFLVHANAIAALASRKLPGVRWLQSIQTTQPRPRWHWWLQRIAQHAAEKIVVPSESVAAVARDWADVPAEKLAVIANAVELGPEISAAPPPQRGEGFFPPDEPRQALSRVGFIGRLDPIKRLPDLIEAVAMLPPPVSLDVWGEGAERRRVASLIAAKKLGARVTLHGAIASPQQALAMSDVLVLPSEAEGFGLVLIEAMAAGVPVVATNVPGIRDVVRDGESGLLVPVGDPAALAAAIDRLLSDDALRAKLIAGGRKRVAERFTWDAVLPAYLKVLVPSPGTPGEG